MRQHSHNRPSERSRPAGAPAGATRGERATKPVDTTRDRPIPVTPRRVAAFLALSALLGITPAWDGCGVRERYSRNFVIVADYVFRSATSDVVRFTPADGSRGGNCELRCTNFKVGRRTVHTLKSDMIGLLPTLGVIALCAATPLPLLRRLRRLVIALILANVFILLRLWTASLYWMSEGGEHAVLPLSEATRYALGAARQLLVTAPTTTFVAPILIWIVAMVRPREWAIRARRHAHPPE